jgi:hypothetical protein
MANLIRAFSQIYVVHATKIGKQYQLLRRILKHRDPESVPVSVISEQAHWP